MADYSSGAIYFTGLSSDIDFDSIITATVNSESYRLEQLEDWEDEWQEKVQAVMEKFNGFGEKTYVENPYTDYVGIKL